MKKLIQVPKLLMDFGYRQTSDLKLLIFPITFLCFLFSCDKQDTNINELGDSMLSRCSLSDSNLNYTRLSADLYIKTQQTGQGKALSNSELPKLSFGDQTQEKNEIFANFNFSLFILSILGAYLILYSWEKSLQLKKVNVSILNKNRELEEINTNLSQFATVAAHDLKAPLRTISAFAQILRKKYKPVVEEEDLKLFTFMMDGCLNMREMIEGLLEHSVVSNNSYKTVPVDMENVIDQVCSNLQISLEETQSEIIIPACLPKVKGQKPLLEQLFLNLISNAIKFRKKGMYPVIEILVEDVDHELVKIGVKDNGIGIDSQYHKEIFRLLCKLHSPKNYEGLGIGLATCSKIVNGLGGDIWVESQQGQGATFYFTLKKSTVISTVI